MDKRYLSHVLLYLVLTVFGIALIVEIAYQFYDSVYDSVETLDMSATTYRQTIDTLGFIGRQETVLTSESSGVCRYNIPDGELVSAGQTVAEVYDRSAGSLSAINSIRSLENQIAILESAQTLASGYTPAAVEKAIAELRGMLVTAREQGDLAAISAAESDLRLMLAISRIVTGKAASYKNDIEALREDLQSAVGRLGDPAESVKSTEPGCFYSSVDGYENLVDFSNLKELDAASCLRVFDGQVGESGEGTPVGKLVDAFSWNLICEVDPALADMLSVGFDYTVLLNAQSTEVTLTLSALLTDEESGRIAAVFTADRMPTGMDFTRFQSVSVVISTYDGYEVPAEALRILDGVTGVYVLHGSVVQFREIQSEFSGDGYIFTPADFESDSEYKPLSFYDRVVVKGKDLYVGKIID